MTGPELGTRPMPLFPQLGAGRIDGVALGITATREQSVDMVSRDSRERGVPSGHPDTRRRCGAPCPASRLGHEICPPVIRRQSRNHWLKRPLTGPACPVWPARTSLSRNHFHLNSGRSPVRSRSWPPRFVQL